jgi:hypothetical protein
MDVYAFSHKEFAVPGKHTSVFRSAVDAFNIFDLFIEVWKNLKWLFTAVILRRPYARQPRDGKFDIYDAVNGKRDVALYGAHAPQDSSYAMLDIPPTSDRNKHHRADDENNSRAPSVAPGTKMQEYEALEVEEPKKLKNEGYSNTYGDV